MRPFTVCSHPLVQSGLARMRDKSTSPDDFRRYLREVAALLFAEATRDLEVRQVDLVTPLEPPTGVALVRPIVLVPILGNLTETRTNANRRKQREQWLGSTIGGTPPPAFPGTAARPAQCH